MQPPASGPYTFHFTGVTSGPAIPDEFGCTLQKYAPPYWFSNGTLMPDTVIEKSSPAVGTVFLTGPEESAIRGVGFIGQFTQGIPTGQSHNIATVFSSNNDCYAGTLEYGFYEDYYSGLPVFYLENKEAAAREDATRAVEAYRRIADILAPVFTSAAYPEAASRYHEWREQLSQFR